MRSAGELNFDFVALILLAGMIAALGLMDNSVVSIIAAMLVSPLMVSADADADIYADLDAALG